MNRRRRLAPPVPGVALLVLLGALACSKAAERHAWTTADPWYAPAPVDPARQRWPEVARERIFEVPPTRLEAAVDRLRDAPAVLLGRDEARELLDGRRAYVWAGKPVLVRGLVLNRGTGAFDVRSSGRQLWVHHGSLGREAVPMERQPVIVFLDELPETVYVSVSMAE